MSLSAAVQAFEGAPLPDLVRRAGVKLLVSRTSRRLARGGLDEAAFAREMSARPIAEHTAEANAQHYELPADFFGLVLGPRRKYSCCLYAPEDGLPEAEDRALAATCANALIEDGQTILELGCGWGALSLWMAEHYPKSRILAVSNSASQRAYIEREARRLRLTNLDVATCDMNVFDTGRRFDRIVSVEMFEHMSNWGRLLERARGWLKQDGRLFLHVFTHATSPYRFDRDDRSDWIAQHFFSGGVMPSRGLIRQFGRLFQVEAEETWDGRHYARTARDWLANMDAAHAEIVEVLRPVYGEATALWLRRWRLFFLATEGLFGHRDGSVWGVSHYRLKPQA